MNGQNPGPASAHAIMQGAAARAMFEVGASRVGASRVVRRGLGGERIRDPGRVGPVGVINSAMRRTGMLNVAILVLVLTAGGCCLTDVPDETDRSKLLGTFKGEELDELRKGMLTDEQRCDAACTMLADSAGASFDRIASCEATGSDPGGDGDGDGDGDALPTWDPSQAEVSVICWVESTTAGFCT